MSPMSDLLEQTQALETLINAIVVTKTKDLETEIKQLRKDLDRIRASASGVPPYILVESGTGRNNTTLVISRQAAESCPSVLGLYGKLTSVLKIKATRSGVCSKTTEIIRYAPMRVLAQFDFKGSSKNDWFEIGEWDESLPGVLSAAIRLEVVLE